MVHYLASLALLFTTLAALQRSKLGQLSPLKVLCWTWVTALSAHLALSLNGGDGVRPLRPYTVLILLTSIYSLIAGYLAVRALFKNRVKLPPSRIAQANTRALTTKVVAVCATLVFISALSVAKSIGETSLATLDLRELRANLNYEGYTWGLIKYLFMGVYVYGVYSIITRRHAELPVGVLPRYIFAVALLLAALSTQRTSVFMVIIASYFGLAPRDRGLKVTTVYAGFLLALFMGIGVALSKGGDLGLNLSENLSLGITTALQYLTSPLSALDTFLHQHIVNTNGAYTLRFFAAIAQSVGLAEITPVSLVQPFVNAPFPTNVYTFSHAPFLDYGGMFWGYHFAIGAIMGLLFCVPNSRPSVITFKAFAYYPIVLSFFQDQFFTILSSWIQIALWLYLFDRVHSLRRLTLARLRF